jgi:hypothetical protein
MRVNHWRHGIVRARRDVKHEGEAIVLLALMEGGEPEKQASGIALFVTEPRRCHPMAVRQ